MSGEEKEVITIEVDFSHIPVKPTSPREVRELELALIIGTLFRPDVLKMIMSPEEFTTWVDSLAVAAGALAREKAGYTISRIAEELGRTETTIRNHLQGKTKAGALVNETYKMLVRGKLRIAIPAATGLASREEVEKLKNELENAKTELERLKGKLASIAQLAAEADDRIKRIIDEAKT
ncbi:MAG: transcriptional regulator [Desulfurococcales archaeon]|nr:transcriptional regulator [Desulfurococcales archaeon]